MRRNADFSGRQNRPGGPTGGIYDFRRTKERRNKISLPARQKTPAMSSKVSFIKKNANKIIKNNELTASKDWTNPKH